VIKGIVVNLSVTEGERLRRRLRTVGRQRARRHLTAIAFVYDPIVPFEATGCISPEVIESQQRNGEAAAGAAIDRFNAVAIPGAVSRT
jgi:hypothetical protein